MRLGLIPAFPILPDWLLFWDHRLTPWAFCWLFWIQGDDWTCCCCANGFIGVLGIQLGWWLKLLFWFWCWRKDCCGIGASTDCCCWLKGWMKELLLWAKFVKVLYPAVDAPNVDELGLKVWCYCGTVEFWIINRLFPLPNTGLGCNEVPLFCNYAFPCWIWVWFYDVCFAEGLKGLYKLSFAWKIFCVWAVGAWELA